jgi:hypothetical protein
VYAEKVRFALDLLHDLEYMEDIHPPALHAGFALRATQNQQSRTPILILPTPSQSDNGISQQILTSSNEIVQTMCPHLYPTDIAQQIQSLEQEWGWILGAATRCVYYVHLLQLVDNSTKPKDYTYYKAMIRLCTAGVPAVEAFLFGVMLDKGVDEGICNCLQLSVTGMTVAMQVLEDTFDKLSQHVDKHNLLQDETAYWMDTPDNTYGFTAADLCLAVYVANFCGDVPALDGLSTNVLQDNDLPPELRALRNRLQKTSVAAYAQRIYRQHRKVHPQTGRIVIRAARRDQTPSWLALGGAAALGVAITTAIFMRRSR